MELEKLPLASTAEEHDRANEKRLREEWRPKNREIEQATV